MNKSNRWITAVMNKDAFALEEILKVTPTFDKVKYKYAGNVYDISAWTRTLLIDWEEGAKLFVKYIPDLVKDEYILFCIKNGCTKVLKVLWQKSIENGVFDYTFEFYQNILKALMAGIGEINAPSFELNDVTEIIQFLKSEGVDINGVVEEEFEHKDFRYGGHSIWTFAWFSRRFQYLDLIEIDEKSLKNWKRLNECFEIAFSYISQDVKACEDISLPEKYKLEFFKFYSKYGKNWLKNIKTDPVPNLYKNMVQSDDHFSIEKKHLDLFNANKANEIYYIQRSDEAKSPRTIIEILCSPQQNNLSSWFKMPFVLNKKELKTTFKIWKDIIKEDKKEQYYLNSLIMHPDQETKDLLMFIKKHDEDLFDIIINSKDKTEYTIKEKWDALTNIELQ